MQIFTVSIGFPPLSIKRNSKCLTLLLRRSFSSLAFTLSPSSHGFHWLDIYQIWYIQFIETTFSGFTGMNVSARGWSRRLLAYRFSEVNHDFFGPLNFFLPFIPFRKERFHSQRSTSATSIFQTTGADVRLSQLEFCCWILCWISHYQDLVSWLGTRPEQLRLDSIIPSIRLPPYSSNHSRRHNESLQPWLTTPQSLPQIRMTKVSSASNFKMAQPTRATALVLPRALLESWFSRREWYDIQSL